MSIYYKLKLEDIQDLQEKGIICVQHVDAVIAASQLRKAGKFAEPKHRFKLAINQAKTIFLNSINFYGGENFGDPYCFLAEITHNTSPSAFTKFMRQNSIPRRTFAY